MESVGKDCNDRTGSRCCEKDSTSCQIQTDYCSSTAAEEELTQSSCCCGSPIRGDETECLSANSNTADEAVASAESACSTHLQAAFERFEALIRLGQCLCKKMIAEFGFCCCCGQRTSCGNRTQLIKSRTNDSEKPMNAIERDCCASKQSLERSRCTGKAKCCASEKYSSHLGQPVFTPSTERATASDVEKSVAKQRVTLNVTGMTCTGCSRKMVNILQEIPAVTDPFVTFVSGIASFDLDPSTGNADEILPLIEKRTGFTLTRVVADYHELEVHLDAATAQAYERSQKAGLVSFGKVGINVTKKRAR